MRARIIGYDLKEDVVQRCNEVAARYGYEGLHFVAADVTRDVLVRGRIPRISLKHMGPLLLIWGLAMYLWSGVLYLLQVSMVLRQLPKVSR